MKFTDADLQPCEGMVALTPCFRCKETRVEYLTRFGRLFCIGCGRYRPTDTLESCHQESMPYGPECLVCGEPAPEPPVTQEGEEGVPGE